MLIAGTATEIAFETVSYLRFAGIRISIQNLCRSHDHTGRAIAALQTVLLPKAFLYRMEIAVRRHAFDGCNVRPIRLDSEHCARLSRLAIQNYRAGAADRGLATDVGAGESRHISDVVDQQQTRLNVILTRDSIYCNVDGFFH